MRIIFFGTPPFAAEVLSYLLSRDVQIVAVVSKPDRPKGRSKALVPTPVKLAVENYSSSIPLYQPESVSSPEFAEILASYLPDLFVVVAYGEIIKQHLLDMPKAGCINLHASLLPKYRGAAPIQRAIIEGEKETGATIMHMVRKMDAGNMIKKTVVPIDSEITYGRLESLLCEAGKKALFEVIREFETSIPLGVPQNPADVTMAPKIELEDCEIQWEKSAAEIHDLIRGVNPFPGAWCYVFVRGEKKRLKIDSSKVIAILHASPPGTILNPDQPKENLLIAGGDGTALELRIVRLEGKKSQSSEELCRGLSRSDLSFIVI